MSKYLLSLILLTALIPQALYGGSSWDTSRKMVHEINLEISSLFKSNQYPSVNYTLNFRPVSFRLFYIPVNKYTEVTEGPYKGKVTRDFSNKFGAGMQGNFRFDRGLFYLGADGFLENTGGYTTAGINYNRDNKGKGFTLFTGIRIRLFDQVYCGPEAGYQFKWWTSSDDWTAEVKNGKDFGFNHWAFYLSYQFNLKKNNKGIKNTVK